MYEYNCGNCGGLVMQPGRGYMYSGPVCNCAAPLSPARQEQWNQIQQAAAPQPVPPRPPISPSDRVRAYGVVYVQGNPAGMVPTIRDGVVISVLNDIATVEFKGNRMGQCRDHFHVKALRRLRPKTR